MRTLATRTLAIAAIGLSVSASTASAQTTISQWNWNSTVTGSYNRPSAGTVLTGTVLGYGQSAPSIPLSTILANGVAGDPGTVISGTTWNRAATINPPLLTAANSSAGVMFAAPTTGMNAGEAVKLSWSQTVGFRSSRYWQLLVSTSGTAGTFSAPTGGTGSSISQFINGYNSGTNPISGTATVNVSSGGLIDFRTINGNWISQAVLTTATNPLPNPLPAGWVDDISYTLPTGQGYENNANFAFAIVGLWDPNVSATSGTTGLVSSFSGLDSTNLITGYNRSVASGGSMRLDLMT
ncbi:MAG: hypothetical protein KGR24_09175, partial [Planctomycetes bacterium]|nr:hypothetical protein [Planctomycetota bacterium]